MSGGDMRRPRRPVDQVGAGAPHFTVIVPHPGEPGPGPEVNDIPRCVAKFEGRISVCNRICTRYRKVTSIANDFEKERLDSKVRTIQKEQTIVVNKHHSELQPLRKSLQELRSYQTVLGRKRTQADLPEVTTCPERAKTADLPPFGAYAGVSIRELRDDIKRMVEESDPRRQRIRKAHALMEASKKKVWTNKPEVVRSKMDAIINRPYAKFRLIPKYVSTSDELNQSAIKAHGIGGPAMVQQDHKGYGNFYTSASQAVAFY